MSIRTALGALPAWPALVIAPILILGIGAAYYGPTYKTCTRLAQAREDFTAAAARAAASPKAVLRLDQAATVSDWDEARIVRNPRAEGPLLDCPFGWDLGGAERRARFAQGRLGILSFAKDGQVVDFIEYPSDRVQFEGVDGVVARAGAVFAVEPSRTSGGVLVMRPLEPDS